MYVQIPDLPALAEVGAVLSAELGYQSLGEQLGRLAPLLKDESTEVHRRFFLVVGGLDRLPVSFRWILMVGGNWQLLFYFLLFNCYRYVSCEFYGFDWSILRLDMSR